MAFVTGKGMSHFPNGQSMAMCATMEGGGWRVPTIVNYGSFFFFFSSSSDWRGSFFFSSSSDWRDLNL